MHNAASRDFAVVGNHSPWRRALGWGFLGVALWGLTGCGGGSMSANDMRKYAIKRTAAAEDDSEDEPKAAAPARAPTPDATTDSQPADEVAAAGPTGDETPGETVATHSPRPSQSDEPSHNDNQQTPSTNSLSDTRDPPATPLSPVERAQTAAANIEQIAAALDAYLENRHKYPGFAMTDRAGTPLLSWRVELLPYLGHKKLYGRFRLDEPWNSPTNRKLLPLIPAVYQSPERFDETTNYLTPISGSSVMGDERGVHPRRIDDGAEHTVFVVEVDDGHAVPWTKPEDFKFDPRKQASQFAGALRSGYFLVAWGGGMAGAVPVDAPGETIKAMFSMDGGETFSSYSISMPLDKAAIAKLAGASHAAAAMPVASSAAPGPTGAGQAPATAAAPVGVVATPANELGREYLAAANAARQLGRTSDAVRWLLAADVANHKSPQGLAFSWIPALRRPCGVVHVGVAVRSDVTVLSGGSGGGRSGRGDPLRIRTLKAVGTPGVEYLELLESYAAEHAPAMLSHGAPTGRDTAAPRGTITYLGAGSRSELTRAAVQNAVDVLVLFDTGDDAAGGRRAVSCEVFDLARGESLLSLPRVQWADDAAGLRALGRDDDFRETKWRLQDFLADRLVPQPLPESLRPRHAVARLAALPQLKTLHPLTALAEMVAYRRLGLVSDRELLVGLRALLGAEAGETLMLGSQRNRERLFREWLPSDDADDLTRLAQQAQRRRDDDDD